MINITGARGSGKTIKIIELANTLYNTGHNVICLCLSNDHKEILYTKGLNPKIKAMTWKEYNNTYTEPKSDILIDEHEYFLDKLLKPQDHLSSFTSEEENCMFIKRSDWYK